MRDDIHEILLTWRRDAGLSQSDVATALHLTRQTVSNIENGRRKPAPYELATLLKQYGKNSVDLRTRPTTHRRIRYRTINLDRYDPAYSFLDGKLHDNIEAHIVSVKQYDLPPRRQVPRIAVSLDLSYTDRQLSEAVTNVLRPALAAATLLHTPDLLMAADELELAHVFAAVMDPTISEVCTYDAELGSVIYVNSKDSLGRRNFSIVHALAHATLDQALNIDELCVHRQERICDAAFAALFLRRERVAAYHAIVKGERKKFTIAHLIKLADLLGTSAEATCLSLERYGFTTKGRWRSLRERGIDLQTIRREQGLLNSVSRNHGPDWLPSNVTEAPVQIYP